MARRRTLVSIAFALALSACAPAAPRLTPSAATASATSAPRTPDAIPPVLSFMGTLSGPFATAVPPTVVSSGDRVHIFAPSAGAPPALRYVAIGSGGTAPPDSVVLPATTIVAATACDGTAMAIVRTGRDSLVVSMGEGGRIEASERFTLPERPWAALSVACGAGGVWIVGMTTDTDASTLWTAPIAGGKLGAASETGWTERTSALSSTVLGGDIVLLRVHGETGGATLIRLRAGRPSESVRLRDTVFGTARVARVGERVAVVWSATEGERQLVRLRLYDAEFAPVGRVRDLAEIAKPERLGAVFAMPGQRVLLAVSYFTSELTDETIELPDRRTEPSERSAQHVVVFDAATGTASAPLRMPMTSGLGAGGWAGDELLFLVSRFSSVVARYRAR